MRATWRCAALAVALAASSRCGAPTPTPLSVELGVGVDFEPLTSSTRLPVHFGPQGGQHVYLNARLHGVGLLDTVRATFVGRTASGAEVCRGEHPRLDLATDSSGSSTIRDGAPCYLSTREPLDGTALLLEVTVTGARSQTANAAGSATLSAP